MLSQSIVNGLSQGCVYVLIALGLALVFSIMRILQFAHGELYMLGGYIVYYVYFVHGVNYFAALIVAGLFMGLVGIALERLMFRRLRNDMEPALLAAIGLSIILQTMAVILFSSYSKWINPPAIFSGVVTFMGVKIALMRLVIAAIGLVLVFAFILVIRLTKVGHAMVAISQDPESASLQGINVNRISSLSMGIGSALAAIAGGLMGSLLSLTPFMGTYALVKAIAIIILGGVGSIPGAIIGGFILGLLDNVVPLYTSSTIAEIAGFAIIILILIVRPKGLFGHD